MQKELEEGDQDMEEVPEEGGKKTKKQRKDKRRQNKEVRKQKDYEEFLQEIEENKEMQDQINMYKDDDMFRDLEAKMNNLNLEEVKANEERADGRKMAAPKRRTKEGKEM